MLIGAADPLVEGRLKFVVSFGGYYDLVQVRSRFRLRAQKGSLIMKMFWCASITGPDSARGGGGGA